MARHRAPLPLPAALVLPLALCLLPCSLPRTSADASLPSVTLGLLMPFPEEDSAITRRLAQEWTSAAKVAVAVLSQKYPGFRVNIVKENSHCYPETGRQAAQSLLDQGAVAVVGPACSVAAQGALEVLGPAGVPMVSFAATTPELGSSKYPTFFRTAFSDKHQAAAIVSVAKYFAMNRIYVFNTQEIYGTSLAALIAEEAKASKLAFVQIPVDYGHDGIDYASFFKMDGKTIDVNEQTLLVFATTPQAAEGLWKAAGTLGVLNYPWWFLAADGSVTFDLVGQGDNLADLVNRMQGEIGIAPYQGDFDSPQSDHPVQPFIEYWTNQTFADYPGLLTLNVTPRFRHPRAYVTSIFDSIWTLYEAFAQILLVEKQETVTSDAVLKCLCNENCLNLRMTTGMVSFSCDTGERNTDSQVPQYSFVNLVGLTWEEKGRYSLDARGLQIGAVSTSRPGPVPDGSGKVTGAAPAGPVPEGAQAPAYVNDASLDVFNIFGSSSGSSNSSGGLSTVGIVFITIASVAVLAGAVFVGVWFHKKRHEQKALAYEQFVHVLPESYTPSFPMFSKSY